eukprot:GHVU01136110.1.p1 GENE.GHVU01136110.1~~GHVU01136110.1.p1  ORF type:complete len:510 (+),score=97.10 GHVU01136110.1:367-1896(+)
MAKPSWAQEKSSAFDVQLYDFSIKGLSPAIGGGPRSSYLAIDFDGKRFMTDIEADNNDPTFGFSKRFPYKTHFIDSLNKKKCKISCMEEGSGTMIGDVSVDLQTMITGPHNYHLTLRNNNVAVGALTFVCVVRLSSEVGITAKNLQVVGETVLPCSVKMVVSQAESYEVEFPMKSDGSWTEARSLNVNTFLWEMLDPQDPAQLMFECRTESHDLAGRSVVKVRQHFDTTPEKPVPFRAPLYKDGKRVGELTGSLVYTNVPMFAQMHGGTVGDGPSVHNGLLLYPGLPYPKCITETPAHLPVQPPDVDVPLEGATAVIHAPPTPEMSHEIRDVPKKIPLPPHWQARVDKDSGRTYFADHRVKRCCWQDPRFLPDGWDQRIDATTGNLYYAYHPTKQTSFTDPRGLSSDWAMRLSKDGKPFFAFHPTQKTTFTDPRGLPPNLTASLDTSGKLYFSDHSARTTNWTDPRQGQTPLVKKQWLSDEMRRWYAHKKEEAIIALQKEKEVLEAHGF